MATFRNSVPRQFRSTDAAKELAPENALRSLLQMEMDPVLPPFLVDVPHFLVAMKK